jgi:antitoxin component of RelBE/YafQ-DinJ toxin-antitoxin module
MRDTMKVVIDDRLKHQFKVICTQREITMSDVVVKLVKGWIEGKYKIEEFDGESQDT